MFRKKTLIRFLSALVIAGLISRGPGAVRAADIPSAGEDQRTVTVSPGEEIELPGGGRTRFQLRVSAVDDFQPTVGLEIRENPTASWPYRWTREEKSRYLNIGLAGVSLLYGLIAWDYGTSSFRFGSEGWFGADTDYGGADKVGHAWTSYFLCNVFNAVYRYWGYDREEAALRAALSGYGMVTVVEFGDGFSRDHGFSWEDQLMNTLGVGLAYLLLRLPAVDEVVDFRMEWIPSPALRHGDRDDFVTDYSGYKFLLAFKPAGLSKESPPALRLLEFQLGYFTRGYLSPDYKYFDEKTRELYVGVGINVTSLLELTLGTSAGRVFDFIQVPYTYISAGKSWESPM